MPHLNKFWIVFFHTYLSKLKSKTFIITTIIASLLLIAVSNINQIIDLFNKPGENDKKIAVLTKSDDLFTAYQQQINVVDKELVVEKFSGTEDKAKKKVLNDVYEGYLVITLDDKNLPQAVYKAKALTAANLNQSLQQALQQLKTAMATNQIGLNQDQINQLYEPAKFEQVALEKTAKTAEELNQARGLVYILLFFIYITVMMYASMIATEVATEKSSRVMEILVSSASPVQQMFGKILGVAMVSITQMIVLLIVGYSSVQSGFKKLNGGIFEYYGFDNIPVSTVVYGIIFFLLGYLLFATMAAVLGSLVSRTEDVQQIVAPMMFLVVAAFIIAMSGLNKPDASFITVTSFIPFFAPMIMFLRVGMLTIPIWQISLSIGLLVLTIILLAIFGAKVYRGGVLLYGKSSSLKDIKKALQILKK